MGDEGANPRSVTGSAGKVLLLLAGLAELGGESSLIRLSRHSGLPKTTTHRLLAVMEAGGAVSRTPGGYQLGDPLLRWSRRPGDGPAARSPAVLVREVKPFLVELFLATRHTVSLAVARGPCVWYLDSLFSHDDADLIAHTRPVAPAHCTAAGKALMAFDPAAGHEVLAQASLPALTHHTITTPQELQRQLTVVRATGLAVMREEYLPGVVGLAACLTGCGNKAVAALSIAGPAASFDWVSTSRALRRSARAASATLRRLDPGTR